MRDVKSKPQCVIIGMTAAGLRVLRTEHGYHSYRLLRGHIVGPHRRDRWSGEWSRSRGWWRTLPRRGL